jgi:hypothetical protein
MTKSAVTLDDKYTQRGGRVFISSNQALVRLPLDRARRDRAAGLKTAGYISGYRGSPLGVYDSALWAAEKRRGPAPRLRRPVRLTRRTRTRQPLQRFASRPAPEERP